MYEYNDETIMTVEELMETLRIGKNAVYRLLNEGLIQAFRIGRVWKIPRNSIDDFIITSAGKSSRYAMGGNKDAFKTRNEQI